MVVVKSRSNRLANLERALGHKLLEGGRRGVSATPFGEALVRRSKVPPS